MPKDAERFVERAFQVLFERPRWLTKTVHGSDRFARRQLEELVAEAGRARIRAGTLSGLLDQWLEAASPGWSASTVSHTRSIVDCHLKPHLGHLDLAKLMTADIDDFYAHLLRAGGRDDRPLAHGTVARVHGVLHRAYPSRQVGLDLDESRVQRDAAQSGPGRDSSAEPGAGRRPARVGEASGPRSLLLPPAGRLDGCPSEPVAGAAVGRRRPGTSRDRLQPRTGRGAGRTRASLHEDPPDVPRRARRRVTRRANGAPTLGEDESPGRRRGADGGCVCIQFSSRRREALAA